MSQYGSYTRRSELRKKRRMNIWLNGLIGVAVLAILFVGGSMIFGGGSEPVTQNDTNQNEEQDNGPLNIPEADAEDENTEESNSVFNINTADNEENNLNNNNEGNSENNNENNEENNNNDDNNENNEENNDNNDERPETEGNWEPIGTVQSEPFTISFERGSTNWNEMVQALTYATGLSEDEVTLWRIENGGDQKSAVGTLSTPENSNTPYQVRIEWVTNEGWMPVSVERLNSNPYN